MVSGIAVDFQSGFLMGLEVDGSAAPWCPQSKKGDTRRQRIRLLIQWLLWKTVQQRGSRTAEFPKRFRQFIQICLAVHKVRRHANPLRPVAIVS